MLFIYRLVFSGNGQAYKTTLAERRHQCWTLNVRPRQDRPVSAAAMGKARAKVDETVLNTLVRRNPQASDIPSPYDLCLIDTQLNFLLFLPSSSISGRQTWGKGVFELSAVVMSAVEALVFLLGSPCRGIA